MLVLTRKKDEQIRIGEDIIITVVRVKGKSVRLGIQAPRKAPVLRGELEFREPRSADSFKDSQTTDVPQSARSLASQGATDRLRTRPLREFLATAVEQS